jgi:hypothetical protein
MEPATQEMIINWKKEKLRVLWGQNIRKLALD